MVCKQCGNPVPPDSVFCFFCGSKIEPGQPPEAKCPVCGAKAEEGAFCWNCGSSMAAAPAPEAVQAPPPGQPSPPAPKRGKPNIGAPMWLVITALAMTLAAAAAVYVFLLLPVFNAIPAASTPAPTETEETAETSEPTAPATAAAATAKPAAALYGMVTDAGTIDDKSFNQGVWEGLTKAGLDFGFQPKYLRPTNAQPTEADYLTQMDALYTAGYRFMVLPGYKFASAVGKAQDKYKDCKFVCIDYAPADASGKDLPVGPNTVAIFYNEHEAGFLAGVATAIQLKNGEIGFIGGMKIPAVQKYNWGFQQGVKYANTHFGTFCTMSGAHVVYQGTFNDVAAGQQIAATMFDAGVKCIFTAAGGVGVGAINEAVSRAKAGKAVWIVGVDVDQYADGIYDTANKKSVIITSAMKGVTTATYDMIKASLDGKFPGGKTLYYSAANGGVGIPENNPNLSAETMAKVKQAEADMKAGKLTVSDKGTGLIP